MAAYAGLHFMAIDGRLQPAVATSSAISAFARRIDGALRVDWHNLHDLAAAFLVFFAAAARARIISAEFHFVSYLSSQGVIMLREVFFCCLVLAVGALKLAPDFSK